ncbi:MAG: hypothetical protein JWP69_1563 [Flaviaesturariibacter sp.]|nr:hypothetical protein [Flaviaesturariibacter sp.]
MIVRSQNWFCKAAMVCTNDFLNRFGIVIALDKELPEIGQFELVNINGFVHGCLRCHATGAFAGKRTKASHPQNKVNKCALSNHKRSQNYYQLAALLLACLNIIYRLDFHALSEVYLTCASG